MARVKSWTIEDVSGWLVQSGFEKLVDDFRDQGVDGEVLLTLTLEELKEEFQMKLGDRKKMIERIENLKVSSSSSTEVDSGPPSAEMSRSGTPSTEIEKFYLLDGRNIACQGGESFDKPNLKKLMKALSWHMAHRPDWKVLTFVYEALMDQWNDEYPTQARDLAQTITKTPRREDVDKFIIRMAADATKRGCLVKIVSNDNFREYIGEVEDFHFSEDWVREHVVKFCFTAGSEEFIPADGIGEGFASDVGRAAVEMPEASATERVAEVDAGMVGLPVLLTGRGAKNPSSIQIATGVEEVRCPHRLCPLRLQVQESRGLYTIQVTGLETPASRAKRPVLRFNPRRAIRSWCPTCARPLELRSEAPSVAEEVRRRPKGKGQAFVAVLFGPDEDMLQRFVLGALVLGHSLRASGTSFDLVLLHTADVMAVPGAGLLEVFWKTREVEYVQAVKKLIARSEDRFRHVFTKLHVFGCDDYEKVVLLDIDLLVRDNVDELGHLKPPCALRRGHKSLPSHVDVALSCYDRHGQQRFGMNLGVAILKPCQEELRKMLDSVKRMDPMHEASNGPEQDFLSRWFKDWKTLSLKYNYQLHQLAYSLDHEGPDAERLQLKYENVKVIHYSGKVKPWDFFFEPGLEQSFSAFCEEKLLPAYGAVGEDLKEKVRRAGTEWKAQCKAMWQGVLAPLGDAHCLMCGEAVPEAAQLEHCCLHCPGTSDLRQAVAGVTWEEIRHPEPREFPGILAFVGRVLERRRWLAAEPDPERRGPSDQDQEAGHVEPNDPSMEQDAAQMPERQPEDPPTRSSQASAAPRAPPRSYENSPLGRYRDKILQEVAANRVTILVAPTGCGKSTRIPQMILDEDPERCILVTQPRRVAATSLARRVAHERAVDLGTEIGYKIGGGMCGILASSRQL
ncbi:unnamed protein product [Symbiodinium natans]|uniref:SAM domain-containing protein n=1 Tax=Symbiodinium natans TaxID=878477 RepID=A0A812GTI9_9DINO|nr:unnamed protein product [Symbiodinium natans]